MREIKFRDYNWEDMQSFNLDNIFENPWADNQVMQYTGLKDSKWAEIYENDIVYIAWQGDIQIEFPFTELYEAYPEWDIWEIKGNIYQNPELLDTL